MNPLILAKTKATTIHLAISFAVFLLLASFIYVAWYPQPYFAHSGGWQGIQFVAAAALVLGPLLTFTIYNPNKTRKAFTIDYSFIIVAQIITSIWGTYAVYSQRPVAVIYHDGKFHELTEEALNLQDAQIDDLSRLSNETPPLIYARKPADDEEQAGAVLWAITNGLPEYTLTFLHQPLDKGMEMVIQESSNNLQQVQNDQQWRKKLTAYIERSNASDKNIVLVPFLGKYGKTWLILSHQGDLMTSL